MPRDMYEFWANCGGRMPVWRKGLCMLFLGLALFFFIVTADSGSLTGFRGEKWVCGLVGAVAVGMGIWILVLHFTRRKSSSDANLRSPSDGTFHNSSDAPQRAVQRMPSWRFGLLMICVGLGLGAIMMPRLPPNASAELRGEAFGVGLGSLVLVGAGVVFILKRFFKRDE